MMHKEISQAAQSQTPLLRLRGHDNQSAGCKSARSVAFRGQAKVWLKLGPQTMEGPESWSVPEYPSHCRRSNSKCRDGVTAKCLTSLKGRLESSESAIPSGDAKVSTHGQMQAEVVVTGQTDRASSRSCSTPGKRFVATERIAIARAPPSDGSRKTNEGTPATGHHYRISAQLRFGCCRYLHAFPAHADAACRQP